MDDAMSVSGLEGVGNLPRDLNDVVERQRPVHEPLGQRLAFDQLEHERGHASAAFETVNDGNGRVIEGCQQLRFALKPRQTVGIGMEGRRQDFQRDFASELRVARPVDLPLSAGSQ
jgi:hypothetical protein